MAKCLRGMGMGSGWWHDIKVEEWFCVWEFMSIVLSVSLVGFINVVFLKPLLQSPLLLCVLLPLFFL